VNRALGGETAPPYGEAAGGYRKREPEEYDRSLCLLPRDVLDFVLATVGDFDAHSGSVPSLRIPR